MAIKLKLSHPAITSFAEISPKSPLSPSVRRGDTRGSPASKWVHFAMVDSEELGVSSRRSTKP